jgi:hypothetical protein
MAARSASVQAIVTFYRALFRTNSLDEDGLYETLRTALMWRLPTGFSMKTIELSAESKKHLGKLQELYQAKKVFDGAGGKLQQHDELQRLLREVYAAIATDIKKHRNITGPAYVHDPKILYNMQVLVGLRHGCSVSLGVYDTDTGTCYYLGEGQIEGCYEV